MISVVDPMSVVLVKLRQVVEQVSSLETKLGFQEMKQGADRGWTQSNQDWERTGVGLHQVCWIYSFWNETAKQLTIISEPYLKFMRT